MEMESCRKESTNLKIVLKLLKNEPKKPYLPNDSWNTFILNTLYRFTSLFIYLCNQQA